MSTMLRRGRCMGLVIVVNLLLVGIGHAITFEWATVTAQGNAPDQVYESRNPDGIAFGTVEYDYRIGRHEVTNAQFAEFLNAVDADGINPNDVYNRHMESSAIGGIVLQRDAAAGQKYVTKPNMADKPVNFVSFFQAMRFVNWLENDQPTDGSGTESGTYLITDGLTETRALSATYFLPTEDEWYKAAFFDPRTSAEGGPAGDDHYWLYATRHDEAPVAAIATLVGDVDNAGANVANYGRSADWNDQNGNVISVGSAGVDSSSYFGTFDQSGNVWEWNETLIDESNRGLRGGAWNSSATDLAASRRLRSRVVQVGNNVGFRVASAVPEPAGLTMGLVGAALLLGHSFRRARG